MPIHIPMKRNNYILAVAGVIGAVVGIFYGIPAYLTGRYGASIGATMLIVGGLVLLAIAFGQEEYATKDIR